MTFVSADARNKYEEVIAHNISLRRQFTALDISRIVQDMLKTEGKPVERHRNLKDILHQLFENDETPCYERTLQDVGGADGPAFVYHHYQDDPATYGQPHTLVLPTPGTILLLGDGSTLFGDGSTLRNAGSGGNVASCLLTNGSVVSSQNPTPALPLGPVPTFAAPAAPAARKKGTWLKGIKGKPLDDKKRIRFPKRVLDAAGFAPGDSVYLSVPVLGGYISITASPPTGFTAKRYAIDCYGNLRADVSKFGFKDGAEFVFKAQPARAVADLA